jgi:ParB family chromosome partitioning protein
VSKQPALGKGLNSLIPTQEAEMIREIALTDIVFNPQQPRKEIDQEKLRELAESIKSVGLVQPILVRPAGSRYMIIAGERRYRACQLNNLPSIKCIVVDCTEQEMTEKAIVENVQRTDLTPLEEGMAYARLLEEYKLTQEQVAQRVGKARSTVTNLLRIIQLPVSALQYLNQGELSLGHAKVLLSLPEQEMQTSVAEMAVAAGWSVRQTEDYIASLKEKNPEEEPQAKPAKKPEKAGLANLKHLEEELRQALQTKVQIKGTEERGRIEIMYYSTEELSRLLELWQVEVV